MSETLPDLEAIDRSELPKTFDAQPYRPDGGLSIGGLLQLVGLLGLTGIILGAIASWISQWFYLVLMFPIGIGALVGGVGNWGIKQFRIRRPLTCAVAGFAAGCLAMLSMHYFDYQRVDANIDKELANRIAAEISTNPGNDIDGPMNDEKARKIATERAARVRDLARNFDTYQPKAAELPVKEQEFLQVLGEAPEIRRGLGISSLWTYLDHAAHQGVELKRGAQQGNGANLGYTGSIIYWGIEALIVAGMAFAVMKDTAGQPFCGECESWKVAASWGPMTSPNEVRTALEQGRLEAFPYDPTSSAGVVYTEAYRCPNCDDGDIAVKLEQVTLNSKGEPQRKLLTQVSYPQDAWGALRAACSPPRPQIAGKADIAGANDAGEDADDSSDESPA
ncbi:MAG: hypothetical protein R3B90_00875 [Planctomycetaceae bacterium]